MISLVIVIIYSQLTIPAYVYCLGRHKENVMLNAATKYKDLLQRHDVHGHFIQ